MLYNLVSLPNSDYQIIILSFSHHLVLLIPTVVFLKKKLSYHMFNNCALLCLSNVFFLSIFIIHLGYKRDSSDNCWSSNSSVLFQRVYLIVNTNLAWYSIPCRSNAWQAKFRGKNKMKQQKKKTAGEIKNICGYKPYTTNLLSMLNSAVHILHINKTHNWVFMTTKCNFLFTDQSVIQ